MPGYEADGLDRKDGLVGASKAFAMMGNYQQAINIVEEAIEDDEYADSPLLSTQLAEVKRAIGESEEALEILQAVVSGLADPPVRTLVQQRPRQGGPLCTRRRRQLSRWFRPGRPEKEAPCC